MQKRNNPRINRIPRRQNGNRKTMLAADTPQSCERSSQYQLQHDADIVHRGHEVVEVLRFASRCYNVFVEAFREGARGPDSGGWRGGGEGSWSGCAEGAADSCCERRG